MLILKGLWMGLIQVAFLAALLILPAGMLADAWTWPRAWAYVIGYGIVLTAVTVWMGLALPAHLAARLRVPVSRAQPPGDRLATAILVVAITGYILFLPFDAFVFTLMGIAPPALTWLGALASLAGFALIVWTIAANPYAIPVVEDQTAQGQVVVDTGPYAYIRHPMYLGVLPFIGGISLWLGCWVGLPGIALLALAMVPRIRVEERTLRAALPGYDAYCMRVPARLLPGLY